MTFHKILLLLSSLRLTTGPHCATSPSPNTCSFTFLASINADYDHAGVEIGYNPSIPSPKPQSQKATRIRLTAEMGHQCLCHEMVSAAEHWVQEEPVWVGYFEFVC